MLTYAQTMAVRSRRIALSAFAGIIPATIYTVPSTRTAVIRSAIVTNLGGNAGTVTVRINGVTCWRTSVPGNDSRACPDDLIANNDDVISAVWSALTDTGTIGLYGSLLSEAPS